MERTDGKRQVDAAFEKFTGKWASLRLFLFEKDDDLFFKFFHLRVNSTEHDVAVLKFASTYAKYTIYDRVEVDEKQYAIDYISFDDPSDLSLNAKVFKDLFHSSFSEVEWNKITRLKYKGKTARLGLIYEDPNSYGVDKDFQIRNIKFVNREAKIFSQSNLTSIKITKNIYYRPVSSAFPFLD